MPLASIAEAIVDYQAGKFVIIVDDEDRENEGDLCIAAEKVTADSINFMAKWGRGLICMPVLGKRLDELNIPLMVAPGENDSPFSTAFTVSIEAKHRVSTGISAHDRAATVHAVLDPRTRSEDLARPGHMFPLRARDGGVLVRAGQTEASIDLAKLAGLYPAAVICEIMQDDGSMARLPELERFAAEHDIKIISVAQLIEHRRTHEKLVNRLAEARLPTEDGEFRILSYENAVNGEQHAALVHGDVARGEPTLVRVHSECLTGDVFGSQRCDCGAQLKLAMKLIVAEGRGVILYVRHHEGRGIGLHNKLRAYALQETGLDTVEANEQIGFKADLRDYGIGAQILVDLGIKKMRLLTNNPAKVVGLQGYGLEIVERVPLVVAPNPLNLAYLKAKREKLGHIFEGEDYGNAQNL
ncbi:MAG: bifunctional 3,4-dihydroxy-2-butanone-4-phosphate synthase/GTP cyclohydrolase II [Chloroflexi bacterium]|nr:bifunctional 3,4-dihydroxy-2-butanone-4-phosphate synthase/GTP cyclohydrolase II [Chloroflexota bacterium]